MKDLDQLFQKNVRRGLLGIITPLCLIFFLGLQSTGSIDMATVFFMLSWIFVNIFLSGYILYYYLEKSFKKDKEIKNAYFIGVLISITVYTVLKIVVSVFQEIL